MLALPADTLTRRGSQSGQITCYEMRTDHVLSTALVSLYLLKRAHSPSLSPADSFGGRES